MRKQSVSKETSSRMRSPGTGFSRLKPEPPEGDDIRISVGASNSKKPPTDNVERFLSLLRFDSKGKLDQLGINLSVLNAKKRK